MDVTRTIDSLTLARVWRNLCFLLTDRGYAPYTLDTLYFHQMDWSRTGYTGPYLSVMNDNEPETIATLSSFIEYLKQTGKDRTLLNQLSQPVPHKTNGTCAIVRLHNQADTKNGIKAENMKIFIQESQMSYNVEISPGVFQQMKCKSLIVVLNAFQRGKSFSAIRDQNVAYASSITGSSVASIDLFLFDELRMNPTRHFLTPKYRLLSEDETNKLVDEASRSQRKRLTIATFSTSLHRVFTSDSMVKWYGFPANSVVEITSMNITDPFGSEMIDYAWICRDDRTKADKDKEKKFEKQAKDKGKKGFTPS